MATDPILVVGRDEASLRVLRGAFAGEVSGLRFCLFGASLEGQTFRRVWICVARDTMTAEDWDWFALLGLRLRSDFLDIYFMDGWDGRD